RQRSLAAGAHKIRQAGGPRRDELEARSGASRNSHRCRGRRAGLRSRRMARRRRAFGHAGPGHRPAQPCHRPVRKDARFQRAPYGAGARGAIGEVCERLTDSQGEADAWRGAWCAMAARRRREADTAAAEGRQLTAGNCYLRAGMYYFTAERFVFQGEEKREIGRKALQCQHAGLERRYPNIERVEVPYENTTLPALFMNAPGAPAPAPTVVVFDGMDNCKEMSVLFAGIEFARRGWNTLAIDGPGQGESLRLRGLYARHDYE